MIANKMSMIGESRTLGYSEHGLSGWFTIFIRGVLCNWMVSMGVVGAMISISTGGKMAAMWMPIMLFFYMGFEHSIVNMFLFATNGLNDDKLARRHDKPQNLWRTTAKKSMGSDSIDFRIGT